MDCPHCYRSLCVEPNARMTIATHDRLLASVSHLHTLGPRVLGEFVIELAQRLNGVDCAQGIATQYNERLSPELLRAAAADRMPPSAVRLVPDDLQLARARKIDRQADLVLQQGDHRAAERLSGLAEKMRTVGAGS